MRVGDAYKIRTFIKTGSTEEEILNRFKWDYPQEEIQKFIDAAKPKKKRRVSKKKVAVKQE